MKFPWQRRADAEQVRRAADEERLAEVRSDWVAVHFHASAMRQEKNLNGWTGILAGLFANNGKAPQ